jgi:hypothetical protein
MKKENFGKNKRLKPATSDMLELVGQAHEFAGGDETPPTKKAALAAEKFLESESYEHEPRISIAPGGEIMIMWGNQLIAYFCADGSEKFFTKHQMTKSEFLQMISNTPEPDV